MSRKNVLFLCTGNSCRSQMAEGLVNHYIAERWNAVSAGTEPSGYVHPLAIQVMAESGIDISGGRSKSVHEFRDATIDVVITLCGDAADNCPLWLGHGQLVHLGFPDPAAATGTEPEQLAVFRQVRDDIRQRVLEFLETEDDGFDG